MKQLKKELRDNSDRKRAKNLQLFFKTGKGQYGEGDIFIGLTVPKQREIAKVASNRIELSQIKELIKSKIHEERLIGLLILIDKYNKGNDKQKQIIFDFYLANTKQINNWDLVDLSAPKIVGNYLLDKKDKNILYKLARSKNLWEKRISIIATFSFVDTNQFEDTLKISKILIKDKHDLIHKAVGWALREVGKKDSRVEEDFLKKYYKIMPRTMLRYSIERFPEDLRLKYLKGKI